jgi:hypothetical protein
VHLRQLLVVILDVIHKVLVVQVHIQIGHWQELVDSIQVSNFLLQLLLAETK